ncbi:hypothetical protein M5689_024580 [Euphorbia peplus]|nr:hypothetical protein M5689_024580 [Euphorbia peplus]
MAKSVALYHFLAYCYIYRLITQHFVGIAIGHLWCSEYRGSSSGINAIHLNVNLKKAFDRLAHEGKISPVRPPIIIRPSDNLERFCDYHQVFSHPTVKCEALHREIMRMIEEGEIEAPKAPSTKKNPLPDYRDVPHPQTMVINSGFTEKEVLKCVDRTPRVHTPIGSFSPCLLVNMMQSGCTPTQIMACLGGRIRRSLNEASNWWSDSSDDKPTEEQAKAVINHVTISGRVFQPALRTQEPEPTTNERDGSGQDPNGKGMVAKQLAKTPMQMSVCELLVSSKEHRDALIENLSTVPTVATITPNELCCIVQGMREPAAEISFTKEDLPAEGAIHNKALFIQVEVKGRPLSCVMVDDGSALNICPKKMLGRLGLTMEDIKPTEMVIRAYDDSKREVLGVFETEVVTGPIRSMVEFVVMDIPVTFALLLGRQWFHPLGGVPSTLHQKIKFPMGDKVITIPAHDDLMVALITSDFPPRGGFQAAMI